MCFPQVAAFGSCRLSSRRLLHCWVGRFARASNDPVSTSQAFVFLRKMVRLSDCSSPGTSRSFDSLKLQRSPRAAKANTPRVSMPILEPIDVCTTAQRAQLVNLRRNKGQHGIVARAREPPKTVEARLTGSEWLLTRGPSRSPCLLPHTSCPGPAASSHPNAKNSPNRLRSASAPSAKLRSRGPQERRYQPLLH